jgi:hypothetical protein
MSGVGFENRGRSFVTKTAAVACSMVGDIERDISQARAFLSTRDKHIANAEEMVALVQLENQQLRVGHTM